MKQKKGYWENTINKALRDGKFSATAKRYATKWNHCSVGEKLNFPKLTKELEHFELEPEDAFLDNLGIQFADSIHQDDPITAGMIHKIISIYDENMSDYAIHYLHISGLLNRYKYEIGENRSDRATYYLKQAIKIAEDRANESNKKITQTRSKTNSSNKV